MKNGKKQKQKSKIKNLNEQKEFGFVIDGDEFGVRLWTSESRPNPDTDLGALIFATSSSLRPQIHEKSWRNLALHAGKRL